ncbi:unnamed protein product [Soboliphyme baturini]|uniref:UDENN domain-containing protein n=1 Tax=Soboliphyme baturini TaxID=241478 RepID=A0A183IUG1_9BILA|nr:unnamed protein product [Soboliphyme baturini]
MPVFDYPIEHVLNLMSLDQFLKCYTCVLLEYQVLLCSKVMYRLMLFAECLQTLLFPFKWQHVYVPILPCSQAVFLEAPLPFIMGLWYEDDIPPEIPESKRISRSFDEDSLYFAEPKLVPENNNFGVDRALLPPLPLNVLRDSEPLARLTAIAKRAGVDIHMESLQRQLESSAAFHNSPSCLRYFQQMRLNNALRETFLSRFLCLLFSYDHFIVSNCSDKETFVTSRDSMQNFDKASFLSDQPESHLPFLAAFLETQMFTSFIDSKIISQWDDSDIQYVQLFDQRLAELRRQYGDAIVRTPTFESCPTFRISGKGIHVFLYDARNLIEADAKDASNATKSAGVISADLTVAQLAQTNWKFVEQLLRDAKAKTKRLLVEKLGKEAVELGHNDLNVVGIEENTLVASLCDLIERIWNHGYYKRKGKSAFWSYLVAFQRLDKYTENGKSLLSNRLTPDLSPWSNNAVSPSLKSPEGFNSSPEHTHRSSSVESSSPRKRNSTRTHSPDSMSPLDDLPTHIAYDMSNVIKMTEIKTEIGSARAFIRLALERKLLFKHLKTMLSNPALIGSLYKRHAFLRCEDEKEQFLYYILSLNAANFWCFTNTFSCTKITYQVVLMLGGGRFAFSAGQPTLSLRIFGSLTHTEAISVPKGSLKFTFEHVNLGILSTLRIGAVQFNSPTVQSRWYLEYAIVRDQITGRTYKFPCGRWFGRSVDDGSLERLLIAEPLPQSSGFGMSLFSQN